MSRFLISVLFGACVVFGSAAAHAEDADAVFARFKAATGGAQWDTLHAFQETGTLSAGGLSGEFHATYELSSGRFAERYQLGPVDGADGYDGAAAWQRDPGGEITVVDAPEAKRRARSQAWLDSRGYWYPQRIAATYGKVESRELEGQAYRIVEATPTAGDPVTLWFAADTHLLERIVQREGADIVTVVLGDYRAAGGVRLPFRSVSDRTDAAGRTDARQRISVTIAAVKTNIAIADAHFAVPAMMSNTHIDDPSGIARIPFDLVNNHIYVDGEVDGKPVRLMVDTGGVNLLTPAAAQRLGLKSEGKLAAGGAGEERADLAVAHANEVRVGAVALDKPVFYVIDLGALPSVEGVAIDGLVGYEMFRRFGVQIDYAGRQLSIAKPDKFAPPPGATELRFDLDRRIPIVSGILDGVPARITIDTGSRSSLTLSAPFVRAHDLVAKYHAAPESVLGWGVGGASRGRPVRLGRLQLAELAIDGIAGDLVVGDKGAFTNPDQAGNLGGGVLKRFTIAFDYARKKMYLAPNAAAGKPDAFDRSGLWLLADGAALKVADVARESAAARAGLRENDRITQIGGEAIAQRQLAEWRERLRELPVGTTLAIEFLRDGKAQGAELTLADRIAEVWR